MDGLFGALYQAKFADSVGNGCRPQGGTRGTAYGFSSCSTLRWANPIPLLHTLRRSRYWQPSCFVLGTFLTLLTSGLLWVKTAKDESERRSFYSCPLQVTRVLWGSRRGGGEGVAPPLKKRGSGC